MLFTASIIWHDSETFNDTMLEFEPLFFTIAQLFCDIAYDLPSHLKCYFQPDIDVDAWTRIQEEMQRCFENLCFSPNHGRISDRFLISEIEATIKSRLFNAASLFFTCSTSIYLMESAMDEILCLYADNRHMPARPDLQILLDAVYKLLKEIKEPTHNPQVGYREPLEYIAQELKKRMPATRNENQLIKLWNWMKNAYGRMQKSVYGFGWHRWCS